MTPIGLPFFSVTSRPSDPRVVKLLTPDWESHFSSSTSVFSVLLKKKKLIGLQCFSVLVLGPARKKQRVVQTQGNNHNLFASQLPYLDPGTCKNWVDINGIPIQEEKQLTQF